MEKIQNSKKFPVSINIVGLILSESYQKCKQFAKKMRKHYSKKFLEPVITGYLDMDWVDYMTKLRRDIGGRTWAVKKGVVVFLDGVFLGSEDELFAHFSFYVFEHPTPEKIKSLAKEEYLSYMKRSNLLYTFFELSLDGKYMGSLLFELRADLLPKTAVWFSMICDPNNHMGFSYKNSKIHRVCKRGWFQGGRLGLGSSAGFLEDESFCYKHDRRGVLSMANYGKDGNRAQYFVTFKPSQWMDEYYVAFGRVVEGSDVLRRLEYTKCTYEFPDHDIVVDNCGVVGVGFGRNLVMKTKAKLKGITVGDPHLHLETFMNLVLDRFDEVLFERLEDELKRQIKGEWMEEILLEAIQPYLKIREPIPDVRDVNDTPSKTFDPALFIKGLYSLKDIPDHFIMELLNEIIDDSVDAVDTRLFVNSIINLIIADLDLERARDVVSVKSKVSSFAKDVSSIVYGQEKSNVSVKSLFQRSVHRVVSQTPTIRKLLSQYSTDSVDEESYEEELEEAGGRTTQPFTPKKLLFKESAQMIASVSPFRKPPPQQKPLPVSQDPVPGGEEEPEKEKVDTGSRRYKRRSISGVASHSSTVRKLMTDYRGFSQSSKDSLAGDELKGGSRSSLRESLMGYIWETVFKALKI